MSRPLSVGDVVQLRSGGPWLTVLDLDGEYTESVTCGWIDAAGSMHEACIPIAALVVSDPLPPDGPAWRTDDGLRDGARL